MSQNSPNLDLLRSMAVLLVLFDHTAKFLGFEQRGSFDINWVGRIGVVFFFVHTSLVLMMSLERSNLEGWPLTLNFWVRRVFRLFPLSCFFVLFTWAVGIPQAHIHPHVIYGIGITPKVLLTNLTLSQNLFGTGDILGQLWSLPIEWNMYLLLPLLFVVARKWPGRFVWLAWPLVALLGWFYISVLHSFSGMWRLNLLSFAPCFVPGVLAYVLSRRLQPRVKAFLWPINLLGLVFLFLLRPSWPAAWIIALALGVSVVFFKEEPNRYVNATTLNIAKYSYGIYLGHTLCIWAAFSFLHRFPWYAQGFAFAVLLIAIPVIAFSVIEKPGIRIGKQVADWLTSLAAGETGVSERVAKAA
jgi:peptidoglycan/LPS O-acetylase OafA/YrhL